MCSKHSCPGYLPYVKEGICRLCSYNSKTHRKYYIYILIMLEKYKV